MNRKKEMAIKLYKRIKREQLEKMKEKMPSDVQGVEFKQNGITYIAFIRRLAPKECDRLQTVPEWYDWGGYFRDAAPEDGWKRMERGDHQALLVLSSKLRSPHQGVVSF